MTSGVVDGGDDLRRALAAGAGLDVDVKDSFQALFAAERAGSDTDHTCIISYPGKGASPLQKLTPFWSGDTEVLIITAI
jgi:hypothetical protein